MIIGVGYHYVRPRFDAPFPGIVGLTTDAFRAQIELLGRHGEFISQADLRRAVTGGSLPKRGWLITFDDGLREQVTHALPVLDALGVPAVFFANTAPVADRRPAIVHLTHVLRSNVAPAVLLSALEAAADSLGITLGHVNRESAATQYRYDSQEVAELKYLLNFVIAEHDRDRLVNSCFDRLLGWDRADLCASLYMSKDQLRELAMRDQLGTHTHGHLMLGGLDAAAMGNEILLSLDHLEQWTGVRPDSIAYPYGSRQACTLEAGRIAAQAGLRMGFTMERAGINPHAAPMFLPRCAPNDLPGGSAPLWPAERVSEEIPESTWYRERAEAMAGTRIE